MSGKNVATDRREPQLGLDAIAFGARPGAFESVAERMVCRPSAARQARRLVSAALGAWGMAELCADAQQIVSELVANVVTHTNCATFRLEVRRGTSGVVRVEVGDRSRVIPEPQRPGACSESGRGLLMVEALSFRWGCEQRRRGKVVWAELKPTRETSP
ncbi:ATP-binding protein [Streptomyces uncialis]|uniref:ATP-binding protein n=1 Tax=Streptomyces uncialis TaxID=1048205 RepID=UPI00379D893D